MDRTKKYFDRLAELHAGIWFEDDKRNYEKLESLAGELIEMRINDPEKAKFAASFIRQSYEKYGSVDDNPAGFNLNEIFDGFLLDIFESVYKYLKEFNPDSQAKWQMHWWKNFF